MMSQTRMIAFLFILALAWGVLLVLEGVDVKFQYMEPLTNVAGVGVLILLAFEKWVWKWRLLRSWFVSVPNVNGTWKGELVSSWKNPDTGEPLPPIEVYLVIHQTYSSIQVRQITKESSSDLLSGRVVKDGEGVYRIAGVYMNTPKIAHRDRSPMHYGAILLNIQGDPPTVISGQYWTDRNTRGDMTFRDHIKKRCYDFEKATRRFDERAKSRKG